MLSLVDMLIRLLTALALGTFLGAEREIVGKKEAGIRTAMLVSGGSAIFSMVALSLPYILSSSSGTLLSEIISRNGGFLAIIGNIVIGIGFLGAGIIVKTDEKVHGLTTSALVWVTAAIGVLCGVGLLEFALASSVIVFVLLFIFRKATLRNLEIVEKDKKNE